MLGLIKKVRVSRSVFKKILRIFARMQKESISVDPNDQISTEQKISATD